MRIKEASQNSMVYKSNTLIEASYKLSALQQHLIHKLTGEIKKQDADFKSYLFNVTQLIEEFGLSKGTGHKQIKQAVKSLLMKPLVIKEPTGDLFVNFVSSAKYLHGEGLVRLRFDPDLKPYLLQLGGKFKIFEQKILFRLKKQYAIRIYELLKQYENMPKNINNDVKVRSFLYEELREFLALNVNKDLGIKKSMYKEYSNFRRIVLMPAIAEINKESDIKILKCEEVRRGRRVDIIVFEYRTSMSRERLRRTEYKQEEIKLSSEEIEFIEGCLLSLQQHEQRSNKRIKHTAEQRRNIYSKFVKKLGVEKATIELSESYEQLRNAFWIEGQEKGWDEAEVNRRYKQCGAMDTYFKVVIPYIKTKE